jgi:predicted RNA-binding protein YlxR (DUF448 family)
MTTGGRPVLRCCVACRTLRDRRELWRVVRQAGGGVVLDQGMGRSAYVCPQLSCLEETRRRRRLPRALRCPVDESLLETLMQRLSNEAQRPTPP